LNTLEDFLISGRLGQITAGITMESVRRILGEPQDESTSNNPKTWKYGGLQLGFYRSKGEPEALLSFIGVYFREPAGPLPESLSMTGWLPNSNTGIDEFRAFLEEAGPPIYGEPISSTLLSPDVHNLPGFQLNFPSGVRASFEDRKLHSIQFAAKRQAEVKQLTITIPKADWEMIRQQALALNVSVPSLFARWVSEQATNFHKSNSH